MTPLFLVPALVSLTGVSMPEEAQKAFDRAYQALRDHHLEAALSDYRRALELSPESWDIWLEYTSALRQAGQMQAAARAGWRTVELKETDARSWCNLGNVFLQARDPGSAWMAFREAAKADPKDPNVIQGLTNTGYLAWCTGDAPLAERALGLALDLAPGHATAQTDLAAVRLSSGKAEGRTQLETVLKTARERKDKGLTGYVEALLKGADEPGGLKAPAAPWHWEPLPAEFRARPDKALDLKPEPFTVQCHQVQNGLLKLALPTGWKEEAPQSLSALGNATLVLVPVQGEAMRLLVTFLPPAAGTHGLDPQRCKAIVAKGFPGSTAEPTWLAQPRGAMAYARDPDWKPGTPGDYPHALQAALQVGRLTVTATLFWGETPAAPPLEGLAMLDSLAWEEH